MVSLPEAWVFQTLEYCLLKSLLAKGWEDWGGWQRPASQWIVPVLVATEGFSLEEGLATLRQGLLFRDLMPAGVGHSPGNLCFRTIVALPLSGLEHLQEHRKGLCVIYFGNHQSTPSKGALE